MLRSFGRLAVVVIISTLIFCPLVLFIEHVAHMGPEFSGAFSALCGLIIGSGSFLLFSDWIIGDWH